MSRELSVEEIEEHRNYYVPLQELQEGMSTEKKNAIFQVSLCDLALRTKAAPPILTRGNDR